MLRLSQDWHLPKMWLNCIAMDCSTILGPPQSRAERHLIQTAPYALTTRRCGAACKLGIPVHGIRVSMFRVSRSCSWSCANTATPDHPKSQMTWSIGSDGACAAYVVSDGGAACVGPGLDGDRRPWSPGSMCRFWQKHWKKRRYYIINYCKNGQVHTYITSYHWVTPNSFIPSKILIPAPFHIS